MKARLAFASQAWLMNDAVYHIPTEPDDKESFSSWAVVQRSVVRNGGQPNTFSSIACCVRKLFVGQRNVPGLANVSYHQSGQDEDCSRIFLASEL